MTFALAVPGSAHNELRVREKSAGGTVRTLDEAMIQVQAVRRDFEIASKGGGGGAAGRVSGGGAATSSGAGTRAAQIVFTNGCFDILHAGHVSLIQQAARLGDFLVVALNTDESLRRLKGSGRPVNSLEDRARVISALSGVGAVIAFDEATPIKLIEALRPEVLVKGADYSPDQEVGGDLVKSWGGRVAPACHDRERASRRRESGPAEPDRARGPPCHAAWPSGASQSGGWEKRGH